MGKAQDYNASSIKVLEGLEAVRVRPGMYIGSTSTRGLNHLIYEIVDNSVDEHLAGYCDSIHVTLERDGSCTVEDNGRGIPIDMHEKGVSAERVVFTTLHAGGKFDNKSYAASGGLHGVGSSVVNALSSRLTVHVRKDGFVYEDRYARGVPVQKLDKGLLPVVGRANEIFEKTRFKSDDIKSRLHETAYLNPQLSIVFTDAREGSEEEVTFHEPDGIRGFVRDLNKSDETVTDIVYYTGSVGKITVEVAFQYIRDFREEVMGFCNNIYNSEGGTHITGFKQAFTTIINNYARELGVLKDKDVNFTGADVRNGMTAVISIKHPDPRFEGQTKTKLDNQDAAKAAAQVTSEEAVHYFDRNLEQLKAVIECAERAAKIRKREARAKTNMLVRPRFSFGGRFCQDGEKPDVSGDSADPRQNFECREGQHGQSPCECGNQGNDQRVRLRLLRGIRAGLRYYEAAL